MWFHDSSIHAVHRGARCITSIANVTCIAIWSGFVYVAFGIVLMQYSWLARHEIRVNTADLGGA